MIIKQFFIIREFSWADFLESDNKYLHFREWWEIISELSDTIFDYLLIFRYTKCAIKGADCRKTLHCMNINPPERLNQLLQDILIQMTHFI